MTDPYTGPAIVELFGHIRLAGTVTEAEMYGGKFLRLNIPANNNHPAVTQFIAYGALFRVTPTTDEIADGFAKGHRPAPVARYELPAINLGPPRTLGTVDTDDIGEFEDDPEAEADEDEDDDEDEDEEADL
jgi:hypothetical protein